MMRFDHGKNRSLWNVLIVWSWLIIISLSFFEQQLGDVEGKTYPVIKDFKVTSVRSNEDGSTTISGEAVKARECSARDVEWYFVDDGLRVSLAFQDREVRHVSQKGQVSVGPWTVYADKDNLLKYGEMVTIHSCHPGYLTRTPVKISGR